MRTKNDRVICGTCQYWTGNREPVFDAKGMAKVDINDLNGMCENTNSRFCDVVRKRDSKCKHYSKWTELL